MQSQTAYFLVSLWSNKHFQATGLLSSRKGYGNTQAPGLNTNQVLFPQKIIMQKIDR